MARSIASSSAWPSVRPVTASHSAPDSRSSTEVSSRNPRTCSGWPLQHLLGQVVQDVAVAAAERRHEPGHVRLAPQRQGGQLQPGRPPFGAGRQRRHRGLGQVGPDRLAQQGRRPRPP